MGSVDKKDYGFASSFLATMRVIGQSLSMVMVSLIFSLNNDLMNSYETLMIIYGILCFVGVFLSIKRYEIRKTF